MTLMSDDDKLQLDTERIERLFSYYDEHLKAFETVLCRENLHNLFDGTRFANHRYQVNKSLFSDVVEITNSFNERRGHSDEGPQPFVFVGLADHSKCMARADIIDGKYLIYFYSGIILTLYSVFCRILSQPTLLPHIGNPSLEQLEKGQDWQAPNSIMDYEDVVTARFKAGAIDPEQITKPLCPIRRAYTRRLMLCAFTFLLFHEVAHFRYGHVQLKQELKGMGFLEDSPSSAGMSWNSEDGWTPMVQQALEYDADASGAVGSMRANYAFHLSNITHKTRQLNETDAAFNARQFSVMLDYMNPHNIEMGALSHTVTTLDDATHTWGFAAAVIFKLMGFDNFDASNLDKFGYPPVVIRFRMSSMTGLADVKKAHLNGLSPEMYIENCKKGFIDASTAFDSIIGEQDHDFLAKYNFALVSPEVNLHVTKLEDQWQQLIPHLRPHAWWPLTNDPMRREALASLNTNNQSAPANAKYGLRYKKLVRGPRQSRRQ